MTGDETEATWTTVDGRRDKMRWRVATKEMPPSLISWDRVNEIGRDCACIRSIHGTRAVFPQVHVFQGTANAEESRKWGEIVHA